MIEAFIIFLGAILICMVLVYNFNYYSETKISLKLWHWSVISLTSVIMVVNTSYNDMYLRIPTTMLLMTVMFFILFKESIIKTLFLSLYIYTLSLLIEFVLSVFLVVIASNSIIVDQEFMVKVIFSLVNCYAFYYVFRLPFFSKVYLKLFSIIENNKKIVLVFHLFLGIVSCLYLIYIVDLENVLTYILCILTISLLAVLEYFYFKELYLNRVLGVKNKYLAENQVLYNTALDNYRLLKHDLRNDFLFIKSLCNEKVQVLIDEKMNKYNIKEETLDNISIIPEGLQGIIYVKSSIAKNYGIDFLIDSNTSIEFIENEQKLYIDLCEVLCIILDNAIEATKLSTKKSMYLNTFDTDLYTQIELANTFENEIDLDEIGNKNYSTKNRGSGIGLSSIQYLNPNISIDKKIINDLFKIIVQIKK